MHIYIKSRNCKRVFDQMYSRYIYVYACGGSVLPPTECDNSPTMDSGTLAYIKTIDSDHS